VDILKALITESRGTVLEQGLSIITSMAFAVDSGDPQNVIVSTSHSAWQAHSIEAAESFVYRRSLEGNEDEEKSEVWKRVTNGLPQ
jgi:hypothetical protein